MPKVAKVKDKWKAKKWIDVLAPPVIGNIVVAKIPVNEDASAVGRTVPVSLYSIFKENPEYNNIKLVLQIVKVEGERAETIIKGIEYAREIYRSMIRRGSSLVELISTHETNDGYKVRLHIAAFTPERINWSKIKEMRRTMQQTLLEMVPNMTYDQLTNSLLTNKLLDEVTNNVKKIYPIKNVILVKMKLLTPVKEKAVEAAAQ